MKVLRRQQANGDVYYVAATKNHKGVYEHFTPKQVEGNSKFEIVESHVNTITARESAKPDFTLLGLSPEESAIANKETK